MFHAYVHWMRWCSSYPVFLRTGSLPAECFVPCPDRAGILLKNIPPLWFWGSAVSLYMNRTPEGDGVSLGTCMFIPAYNIKLLFQGKTGLVVFSSENFPHLFNKFQYILKNLASIPDILFLVFFKGISGKLF